MADETIIGRIENLTSSIKTPYDHKQSAIYAGKGIHPGEKALRKAINATIDKFKTDDGERFLATMNGFPDQLKQELIDAICKALWAG